MDVRSESARVIDMTYKTCDHMDSGYEKHSLVIRVRR
jgi:hypothetical protein